MNVSISSSFVDHDAMNLVLGLQSAICDGKISGVRLDCVISTREFGDNAQTDTILQQVREQISIPLVCVSAEQAGRLVKSPSDTLKDGYDLLLMKKMVEAAGRLPDVNVMLGDMVIKGPEWCRDVPSLNLHPDLPISLGGVEGIYWNVIGAWVKERRAEIGGMMHLAVPKLDAGTPVAYFRLPARGIVNGVDLGELWKQFPAGEAERADQLFQALRKAEADFEPTLVYATVAMLGNGTIRIQDGKIFDDKGHLLNEGIDLTGDVVGDAAIWPGKDVRSKYGKERF